MTILTVLIMIKEIFGLTRAASKTSEPSTVHAVHQEPQPTILLPKGGAGGGRKCMLVIKTLPCLLYTCLSLFVFMFPFFKTKAEDIHGRGRGLGPARIGIVFSFPSN